MNIPEYIKTKSGVKTTWVTCYDYPCAKIIADSNIDGVLIGDSVAMAVYGFENTLHATTEMIAAHTAAVARGLQGSNKLIVADLPFLSYRSSLEHLMSNALLLMRSGAHALKLEGAQGHLNYVTHLVQSGVPIMGHLGLTPQSLHQLGGFKVQGKSLTEGECILNDARDLERAGCFALVLECVPQALAAEITKALSIPVIGIGAGSHTDGQILVWHDLMGYPAEHKPKFVRNFANTQKLASEALDLYCKAVTQKQFPNSTESYGAKLPGPSKPIEPEMS